MTKKAITISLIFSLILFLGILPCFGEEDVHPPSINLTTAFPITIFEGMEVTVQADVTDYSGVQWVRIGYDIDGQSYVEEMVQAAPPAPSYTYEWTYVAGDIGTREKLVIRVLNITASDIYSNWVSETYDNTTITVLKEDLEGPWIQLEAMPLYTESEEHLIIRAAVSDPSGVQSATLYYETEGNWYQRSMNLNEENGLYEAIIGPFATDNAVRYYVNATDDSGNHNVGSTLEQNNGEMSSFVASSMMRFEGTVEDSNYMQVEQLHRYRMTKSRDTIRYANYIFSLELGEDGLLTGNVSVDHNGTVTQLQEISLSEKNNVVIHDEATKDGLVYDFNLKYLSYDPDDHSAEIEINPRQKLVFEAYTIYTYIKKVNSGPVTFVDSTGGNWQVNMTVELGYQSITKTFTTRNQFLDFIVGDRREIQVFYLGEELSPGEITRYLAKIRVYKFQPPVFEVECQVPTGSPPGLPEGENVYNVYAGDELRQVVIARNLAGSRAYDINITYTNVTGYGLTIYEGELTSTLGPVYREKQVGGKTIKYYLTYGTLTKPFDLVFPSNVDVRQSASFDVLLTYRDAHDEVHQMRVPVRFLIYPSPPVLTVNKRLTRDPLFIGYEATAFIEVENIGGSPAEGVVVVDNTPPNLISDFEPWRGEIKPGSTNKVSLSYSIKPTTITTPGRASYGFVTVEWRGVCDKPGVRNDAYTLSTQDFYFTALGPHISFTSFDTDRPITEQDGQKYIFINVGEKVTVTGTIKNDGNKMAKNLSLDFPGFKVESTDFPMGTDVDVGQYLTFTATVVAVHEGSYPFQARITHGDEYPSLGNVYRALSQFIMARTYLSPIAVQFIDAPDQISAGETETITISIRNVGNSRVENARVQLTLTRGLSLVYGTYTLFEGTLEPMANVLRSIKVQGTEFGENRLIATASGKDISEVTYVQRIMVLSPHIEVTRTIDCPFLLARKDYWPRSSEIVSTVTLTLRNTGNDRAVSVVVSETLPSGIHSFDNLTFGSNLIVWGETGGISLEPNETLVLRYPIWAYKSGEYEFGEATVSYTNPQHTLYESRSQTMKVWVLDGRPFIVQDSPPVILGENGEELSGPVTYNDTVTVLLTLRNIGNRNATSLDLAYLTGGSWPGLNLVLLNRLQLLSKLDKGIATGKVLQVPITFRILEDVKNVTSYQLVFPLTYSLDGNPIYNLSISKSLLVRPAVTAVEFSKDLSSSAIESGERPVLQIVVRNAGDTDLRDVQAVVQVPDGLSIENQTTIPVLREGETGTIRVVFSPVTLGEDEVYRSFSGFSTYVVFDSFRGGVSTASDDRELQLSVMRPYVDVRRVLSNPIILARNEDWPYASLIKENVTLILTNRGEVPAQSLKVTELIPEGLYTDESLGISQIVWGSDGELRLEKGQSMNLTYPIWAFSEGQIHFGPCIAVYSDPSGHKFQSLSTGIDEVQVVAARPFLVWDRQAIVEPAGSLTYNDTLSVTLAVRNIGNSRGRNLRLKISSYPGDSDGFSILNGDELNQTLSMGLMGSSVLQIPVEMRVRKDISTPQAFNLFFSLAYADDESRSYLTKTHTQVFVRPAKISAKPAIVASRLSVNPGERGYVNVSVSNTGDTDLLDVSVGASLPDGLSIRSSESRPVLREGSTSNLSLVLDGVELNGSVGKVFSGINLTVSYRDFRGDVHIVDAGSVSLSVSRPMIVFSTVEAKSRTRIGRQYKVTLVILNQGTAIAKSVRIQLGGIVEWLDEIKVNGADLVGEEVILGDLMPQSQVELDLEGKVKQKGEFSFSPTALYADAAGNGYSDAPQAVAVKSGEKLVKVVLPFLLWAFVGAGIGGVYYYETRIAEKIKGHHIGSLSNSVITHIDATKSIPPFIPFRKKKLTLAEFAYLLSMYINKAKSSGIKRADKTTFIILHPKSRIVPGQEFKNLVVVKDAYLLVAQMIQNRVKTSHLVPPSFLIQGFKFGISDIVYLLSLAVAEARNQGELPRTVTIRHPARISAVQTEGEAGAEKEAERAEEREEVGVQAQTQGLTDGGNEPQKVDAS